jgi:adenylate kinase family enzyme
MKPEEIIRLLQNEYSHKNILVIGYPASGKTTFAKKYIEYLPQHTLIDTDDYIPHGHEQSLYVLIEDLKKIRTPTLIGGVLGYRLLRKGVQLDCYYPDVVFELTAPWEHIEKVYQTEREEEKIPNLKSFIKSLDTILKQYQKLPNPNPPLWHKIDISELTI